MRRELPGQGGDLAFELALLAGQALDPAGDAAERVQGAAQLDIAVTAWLHRCESLQQPAACERPQLAAQRLGGRDDQVAQLAESGPAGVDGAVAGSHQSPQRLALTGRTWLRRMLLRKHNTGGTDRVERVSLAARAAFSPQPADLVDSLAPRGQEAGQAGTERAAALDREGTPTRRRLVGQFERTSITSHARGDRRLSTTAPVRTSTTASACTSRCGSTPTM